METDCPQPSFQLPSTNPGKGKLPDSCKRCGGIFEEEWQIKRHAKDHADMHERIVKRLRHRETNRPEMSDQIQPGVPERPYKCTQCPCSFMEDEDLQDHTERCHPKLCDGCLKCVVCSQEQYGYPDLVCQVCYEDFDPEQEGDRQFHLEWHYQKVHGALYTAMWCNHCPKVSTTYLEMCNHMDDCHDDIIKYGEEEPVINYAFWAPFNDSYKLLPVEKTGLKTKNKALLIEHVPLYPCSKVNITSWKEKKWNQGKGKFRCWSLLCKGVPRHRFKDQLSFKLHVMAFHCYWYTCSDCKCLFNSEQLGTEHVRTEHVEKEHDHDGVAVVQTYQRKTFWKDCKLYGRQWAEDEKNGSGTDKILMEERVKNKSGTVEMIQTRLLIFNDLTYVSQENTPYGQALRQYVLNGFLVDGHFSPKFGGTVRLFRHTQTITHSDSKEGKEGWMTTISVPHWSIPYFAPYVTQNQRIKRSYTVHYLLSPLDLKSE